MSWVEQVRRERTLYSAVGALIVLGICLRWSLMGQSLWLDEIYATRIFLKDTAHLLYTTLVDDRLPLYYIFLFGWVRVFGDSEVSVRMPSLIAAALSMGVFFQLVRRIAGVLPALLALAFLVLSPVHIYYSAEARPYSLLVLFCLSLVYSLGRWSETEGRSRSGWRTLYVVSAVLMLLTHYYMVLVVFPVGAVAFAAHRRLRGELLRVHAGLALLVAAFLLARSLLSGASILPPSSSGAYWYLRPFTPHEAWLLVTNWFFLGGALRNLYDIVYRPEAGVGALHLYAASLTFYGGLVLCREGDAQTRLWRRCVAVAFAVIPAALFLFQAAGYKQTYVERSTITCLPFFLIFFTVGLVRSAGSSWPKWTHEIVLALVGVGLAGCFIPIDKRMELVLLAVSVVCLGLLNKYLAKCAVLMALAIQISVCGQFLQKNPVTFTVALPRLDWRSATRFLSHDLGMVAASGRTSAIFATKMSTELIYYDRALDDHEYREEIERIAPRVRRVAGHLGRLIGEEGERRILGQLDAALRGEGKTHILSDPPAETDPPGLTADVVYIVQGTTGPEWAQQVGLFITHRLGYVPSGTARFGEFISIHRFEKSRPAPTPEAVPPT